MSIEDLDASMFAKHPDGYLCRCGAVHVGKTISCVCSSDFPEQVIADLRARVATLEDGIRKIADVIAAAADYHFFVIEDLRHLLNPEVTP